jgi:hypothetical protein
VCLCVCVFVCLVGWVPAVVVIVVNNCLCVCVFSRVGGWVGGCGRGEVVFL